MALSPLGQINNRIAGYESEADRLGKTIREKSLEADSYRDKALQDSPISLQDALISAAIQIVPGIMGYLASGKGGAAIGLNSGLAGGQLYQNILDTREKRASERNALQADMLSKEVSGLQSQRDKLETRGDSLQDKLAFDLLNEEQRRTRPKSGTAEALGNISSQLTQFLSGGKQVPDEEPLSDEATTPDSPTPTTGEQTDSVLGIKEALRSAGMSDEQIEADPNVQKLVQSIQKTAKGNLDIQGKIQDVQQSQEETKKTQAETILLKEEIEDRERYKNIATEGLALPDAGIQLVPIGQPPNGATPEGREQLEQLKDYAAAYEDVISKLATLSSIIKDKNAIQRIGDARGPDVKKALIKSLARLSTIADTGNKAPNDAERKAAADRLAGLNIDDLWKNIKEQGSVIALPFIKSFQEQIRSIISTETKAFEGRLRAKYGMGLSRISDVGSSPISRFNEQNVREYTNPQTGETILVDEGAQGGR